MWILLWKVGVLWEVIVDFSLREVRNDVKGVILIFFFIGVSVRLEVVDRVVVFMVYKGFMSFYLR